MSVAIITVRANSSRLNRKCFLELDNKPIIQHVINRVEKFGFEPVVSTTYADSEIINLCKTNGVKFYAGSIKDKVKRWLDTCDKFGIEKFVTVDCDDPLFDEQLTHEIFESTAEGCVGEPDLRAYLGSHGWVYSYDSLKKICDSKKSKDTEMVWHYFPSDVEIQQFDARPEDIESNIRLTLDYEEDYWLLKTVVRELGPMCSRKDIVDFFVKNNGLTTINSFRNVEWKQRQSE